MCGVLLTGVLMLVFFIFCFKQTTAYEMRISDWSSDVCSSDLKYDWQANGEARHVGVTLPSGVRLDNVYIPAGGDIPDRELNPKFGQKLDFFGRMTEWSGALNGTPTVLTGD